MKTRSTLALILALVLCTTAALADTTPAPAIGQRFALPLSDGTVAQAVILAGPDQVSHLVYATSTGQLVFLPIGTQNVNPPIPPPQPGKKRVAIVEDPSRTTWAIRQVLADKTWREYVTTSHDFLGVIPADLIDPETQKPPPRLSAALNAATGRSLPCVVILDQNDAVVSVADLPSTAAELLNSIKALSRRPAHATHHQ